jgi:hypothetical protein
MPRNDVKTANADSIEERVSALEVSVDGLWKKVRLAEQVFIEKFGFDPIQSGRALLAVLFIVAGISCLWFYGNRASARAIDGNNRLFSLTDTSGTNELFGVDLTGNVYSAGSVTAGLVTNSISSVVGKVTFTAAGVSTISAGSISNADISATAGISPTKLSGNLFSGVITNGLGSASTSRLWIVSGIITNATTLP